MELTREQLGRLIGLADARKLLRGKGGRPPNLDTVRGWVSRGYKPSWWQGEPLRLRAWRRGRDWVTLPECCDEFQRLSLAMGEPAATAG